MHDASRSRSFSTAMRGRATLGHDSHDVATTISDRHAPTCRSVSTASNPRSTGTSATVLGDCTALSEVPFTSGVDDREHDFKQAEQQSQVTELFAPGCAEPFKMDIVLRDLRGILPSSGTPVEPGTIAESSFMETQLADFFSSETAASYWHTRFCALYGATELQRRDAMAARPSLAAARAAPLLRELEPDDKRISDPARFLELIWEMWCTASGTNAKGEPIVAEAALV